MLFSIRLTETSTIMCKYGDVATRSKFAEIEPSQVASTQGMPNTRTIDEKIVAKKYM